tara:strand:+ start:77 stop:460 length:384 start_codon:yes stop_codon:yes gene_type:complete
MGGTVGERLGTKEVAEGAQRRAQNFYHKEIAAPADEYGMHWGQQTGKAMDGFNHAMGQVADTIARSDLNISNWGRRDDQKQEAQTASANYTGQASTQRSGSGKRGSGKLTSTDKKSGKGKRALTIQK